MPETQAISACPAGASEDTCPVRAHLQPWQPDLITASAGPALWVFAVSGPPGTILGLVASVPSGQRLGTTLVPGLLSHKNTTFFKLKMGAFRRYLAVPL